MGLLVRPARAGQARRGRFLVHGARRSAVGPGLLPAREVQPV